MYVHMYLTIVPPSPIVRLEQTHLQIPYVGILEVFYNEQWGRVCHEGFGTREADVACFGLNYTNGAICYFSQRDICG